ncbi:MAG: coproporphyrinogen dehydrogenase HemZ [Bacillota bacterium]
MTITPWGTLMGIRPGKIVHTLWDEGWADQAIITHLMDRYHVSDSKARLLIRVCRAERPLLPTRAEASKQVGVYVGIPFCPSRCSYCSFPSHSVTQCGHLMAPFVDALIDELSIVLDEVAALGLEIPLIYVGGGTPSALTIDLVNRLVGFMAGRLADVKESTFEAGRPETISDDLLDVLKCGGIQRLSINPQTMNDQTLELIGRKHSSLDIREAYARARSAGFAWINMDMIAGLPGETAADFRRSIDEVSSLHPGNITVHTLALKRASRLRQGEGFASLPQGAEVVEMVDYAEVTLEQRGYEPYYLYRQRDILGGLENVGYTLPSQASRYNAAMISERLTVLGFGGGAASKFVDALRDWQVYRLPNPKDVYVYLNGGRKWADAKVDWLRKIFGSAENNGQGSDVRRQ